MFRFCQNWKFMLVSFTRKHKNSSSSGYMRRCRYVRLVLLSMSVEGADVAAPQRIKLVKRKFSPRLRSSLFISYQPMMLSLEKSKATCWAVSAEIMFSCQAYWSRKRRLYAGYSQFKRLTEEEKENFKTWPKLEIWDVSTNDPMSGSAIYRRWIVVYNCYLLSISSSWHNFLLPIKLKLRSW